MIEALVGRIKNCLTFALPCVIFRYDILVTNPPYSKNHVSKLLDFVAQRPEPHLLCMPSYVMVRKEYECGALLCVLFLNKVYFFYRNHKTIVLLACTQSNHLCEYETFVTLFFNYVSTSLF